MNIAIVHEWLSTYAGAEKVLEQLLLMYPQAELFSTVDFLNAEERHFLHDRVPRTSFIQKLPFAKKHFRNFLPLMPMAVEQHDLSAYEIVISSSHACAKGVLTRPGQFHACYIHSPIRYAWDLQDQYLSQVGRSSGLTSFFIRAVMHYLRLWDRTSADRVDLFIANSRFVASRVRKYYRRRAKVVHPPVDIDRFQLCEKKEDYYLTVGRMVPYKRTDLIVEAFSSRLKNKKLVVVGDGPEFQKIRKIAGPNVELLGYQPADKVTSLMQLAKGYVFAAVEDFGIATVEAQACGTPVIALGRGGTLDIVIPDRTGVLFEEQSASSLAEAINTFESRTFSADEIRKHAERFHPERFAGKIKKIICDAWCQYERNEKGRKQAPKRIPMGAGSNMNLLTEQPLS